MSDPEAAVILVHGLWMKRWTWSGYRKQLQRAGFRPYLFRYNTTRQVISSHATRLAALINSRPEQQVHMITHSMGGILALMAMPQIRKPGKLVMLGSPIGGSKVVRKLQRLGWDRRLLKHATKPLLDGIKPAEQSRETLMIAGDAPLGLGRLIAPGMGPGDGTVALSETRAEWLDQHITIHTSHFGLLSHATARQHAIEFLSKR